MQIYYVQDRDNAKDGSPIPYGGFPLTNLEFKMWLHLKMLIDGETPLINQVAPLPVDRNCQKINMSVFLI
jgi:hypothetical protein